MTPRIEDILKVANVHPSRVKGCYFFGSRVYGTASETSDWDVILVANSSSPEREFKSELLNVHVIVPDLFTKYVHDNHVKAIECIFAPEWAVLKAFPCEFVYRERSFRHNFSHTVSNSWVKCMKKLAQGDYYQGTKSIFHALRIADFGVQFATQQKIDFASSNHVWEEISAREWSWEELKSKYQPLRNSLLTQLRKVAIK
jgi:predicted nucleotidyltransferase